MKFSHTVKRKFCTYNQTAVPARNVGHGIVSVRSSKSCVREASNRIEYIYIYIFFRDRLAELNYDPDGKGEFAGKQEQGVSGAVR